MAIILEGFDNCGKSTLATKLGFEIVHPGPAPKSWAEEEACMEEQLMNARLPVVYDRVTCISSQVYRNRVGDRVYLDYLNQMLMTPQCILIYCRPPDDVILNFDNHNVKAHDTLDHLKRIKDGAKHFLKSYDNVVRNVPHLVYNYTKPDDSVIQTATDCLMFNSEWKKWMSKQR